MAHAPQPASRAEDPAEILAGLVQRVVFHNPENGFCVLRVEARGHREPVTLVGHAALISAGEFIQASGNWANDRTHGVQFRAAFLKATQPTTKEAIEKYLASRMIRGIGPIYAKKLVQAFGDGVFEVIENNPGRLRRVPGIGAKRANQIARDWAEQLAIREIMLFLPHLCRKMTHLNKEFQIRVGIIPPLVPPSCARLPACLQSLRVF